MKEIAIKEMTSGQLLFRGQAVYEGFKRNTIVAYLELGEIVETLIVRREMGGTEETLKQIVDSWGCSRTTLANCRRVFVTFGETYKLRPDLMLGQEIRKMIELERQLRDQPPDAIVEMLEEKKELSLSDTKPECDHKWVTCERCEKCGKRR